MTAITDVTPVRVTPNEKLPTYIARCCRPLRLANIAVDLDERWGTGVWGDE